MITLPFEAPKYDLCGAWAMVTVCFWPPLTAEYVASNVRFLFALMLFSRLWICDWESPLAEAGRVGNTTTERPTTVASVRRRERMAET